MHRDGVIVVLYDKDHWKFLTGCPVERLVKISLRTRALSRGDIYDLIESFHLRAQRAPYGLKKLASCWGALWWDSERKAAVVHRHHATVRVRILRLIHCVHHDLFRGHSHAHHKRHVAVVGIEPILSSAEDLSCRYLNTFMTSTANLEVALILFVESDCFFIKESREQHRTVRPDEGLGV